MKLALMPLVLLLLTTGCSTPQTQSSLVDQQEHGQKIISHRQDIWPPSRNL